MLLRSLMLLLSGRDPIVLVLLSRFTQMWLYAGEGEPGGIALVDEPPRAGPGAPLLELAGVSLRTPGGGRGLVDGLDLRVRCASYSKIPVDNYISRASGHSGGHVAAHARRPPGARRWPGPAGALPLTLPLRSM